MKNSCLPPTSQLQEVNLVYQYTCNIGDCSHLNSRYIGLTTTTLSKRISAHLQDGAIRRHHHINHGPRITRQQMEDNTRIVHRETDKRRLKMAEAVLIYTTKPAINIQVMPDLSLPSNRRTLPPPHPSLLPGGAPLLLR